MACAGETSGSPRPPLAIRRSVAHGFGSSEILVTLVKWTAFTTCHNIVLHSTDEAVSVCGACLGLAIVPEGRFEAVLLATHWAKTNNAQWCELGKLCDTICMVFFKSCRGRSYTLSLVGGGYHCPPSRPVRAGNGCPRAIPQTLLCK
jgi:hypothetical protein